MIKSLLDDEENQPLELEPKIENKIESQKILENPLETNTRQTSFDSFEKVDAEDVSNFINLPEASAANYEKPMFQTDSETESAAATARKSGLAYAAAITLFAAIALLLGVGWLIDLLLGTSPWGKVGGIVLGSIIGFFQFFRLTSQILKDKD